MLENEAPKFEKARNCTTNVASGFQLIFSFFERMAQLVPNIGKIERKESQELYHRESWESYHFWGAKMDTCGGTKHNSPVVLFLTFMLLLVAVYMRLSKNGGAESNSLKGKEVVLKITLWQIYIYICICICGWYLQVQCGNLGFRKFTENVVWNGAYRYEMLYFLGCEQEPTVNTAKQAFCGVCDVTYQTLLAASKYCKTSCFRCLTLKKNKIATLHLKAPHI